MNRANRPGWRICANLSVRNTPLGTRLFPIAVEASEKRWRQGCAVERDALKRLSPMVAGQVADEQQAFFGPA